MAQITACVKLYNSNLLKNQKCKSASTCLFWVYRTEIMGSLISQKGVYAVFPFANREQWCRVLLYIEWVYTLLHWVRGLCCWDTETYMADECYDYKLEKWF